MEWHDLIHDDVWCCSESTDENNLLQTSCRQWFYFSIKYSEIQIFSMFPIHLNNHYRVRTLLVVQGCTDIVHCKTIVQIIQTFIYFRYRSLHLGWELCWLFRVAQFIVKQSFRLTRHLYISDTDSYTWGENFAGCSGLSRSNPPLDSRERSSTVSMIKWNLSEFTSEKVKHQI